MSNIEAAAEQRIKTIEATSEDHRREFSQHLTPKETAQLAASMFSPDEGRELNCLDLGAGTGMLSVALASRYENRIAHIDCVELDPVLAQICDKELGCIDHTVIVADALVDTPVQKYDRVILNPPYKKLAADDSRQVLLPIHSANLYSAFLAIALTRLAENGEVVAIIPRSWTNGDYFTPFRKWALGGWSLDSIHVYGSRDEVFQDTKVLQETMLVRFSKRAQAPTIKVSQSTGKADEIEVLEHPTAGLITGENKVVRIAPSTGNIDGTIASRGFCPSTGKVVDFRSRERIYMTREQAIDGSSEPEDVFRLVYAGNMRTGELHHPADIGKCQWFRADDKSTRAQLVQPGSYVLVKRFSSKEETRRVVAHPLTIDEPVALENHTSFIHQGTSRNVVPLANEDLARGMAVWLNSTYIDGWFRDVSGSTQVNAKDIKAMPCPDNGALTRLSRIWHPSMAQEEVDEAVRGIV